MNNVISIGCYAFVACKNLTAIMIPESVTCIDNYAFIHCTSLSSIHVPDSLTSIGHGTFLGCNLAYLGIYHTKGGLGKDVVSEIVS